MKIEITTGIVSKDGQQIGVILDDTCYVQAMPAGPVKGAINKEHGSKLAFVVGPVPDYDPAADPTSGMPPRQPGQEPQTIADLLELAKSGKISQPPAMRPDAGDKTPAFISWVKANTSPEVFQRLYGHRKYTMDDAEIDRGNEAHRVRLANMEKNKNLPLA